MKNLANCKPSEFLKQTNKIKKSLEKWMTDIDLKKIRSQVPALEQMPKDASDEEKRRILEANRKKIKDQGYKNFSMILDAALDEHPDETLEVLALLCFVDPEDVDNHPVSEYLTAISELMTDEAVINFFTSFSKLGQMNILNASNQ
jgi:hypothetical protein